MPKGVSEHPTTRLIGSLSLTVRFNLDAPALKAYTVAYPKRVADKQSMSSRPTSSSVIQQFRVHETDTGSPQVQIALLTDRINQLSAHFQAHKKDFSSRQGLLKMVSRRRRLLEYLKRCDERTYRTLLDALKLRK